MKQILITALLAGGLPFLKASAGKLETSGYNCRPWTEVIWIQVLRTPICVGKARCWPKGKCPNKGLQCTAVYGKDMDIFCKADRQQKCPAPVQCIEDTSNTIKNVKLIKGKR